MKKNDTALIQGAAVRAAIQEVLTKASRPMAAGEIRNSPEVKATGVTHGRFDSVIYLMNKNNQITRTGKNGSFRYEPLTVGGPVVEKPRLPKVIDRGHERHKPGEITARYNSKTGGIQLEFNGHFVLNFEKS